MNRDARDQAIKNAEAQYKADKAGCASPAGPAKDVCMEGANVRYGKTS